MRNEYFEVKTKQKNNMPYTYTTFKPANDQ